MKEREIEYKTLDELKLDIIKRLVNLKDNQAVNVTRCYESLTGSLISHSVGEDAPAGKFKVIC